MPSREGYLRILPLGGLGEIGMNCMVLQWGREIVLLDCGIQFPDSRYLGVDLLAPDLRFLLERMGQLKGVVITHGHEDHIGAIPFLAQEAPLDIYASPFPQGLIDQKLNEYSSLKKIRYHTIQKRKKFKIGPFKFDPIPVQHSIIESWAFAIETPVGTVIHTGDFKHDEKEAMDGEKVGFKPFQEYGKKGVSLLLSDSTNAERHGHTLSEIDIAESFDKIFKRQKTRLIIALFASNIRRVQKFLLLAKKHHKKVAFIGRSMSSYTRLAHALDKLDIPKNTLVAPEQLGNFPDNQVILLATGSQAEPQSALVRIAHGTHRDFTMKPGDTVILSSRFIPGNERAITSMIDQLYRQGAEVVYESIDKIHVSGHGFQDELMMMLEAVKPKHFIPIHGEFRHLVVHSKLARKAGVPAKGIQIIENGQSAELGRDGLFLSEKFEFQKGVIVQGQYMEGAAEIFAQRAQLSRTGIVFVALTTRKPGEPLTQRPKVIHHGLLLHRDVNREKLAEGAEDEIAELYPSIQRRSDIEDVLRIEVRRFFKRYASHKPVVIPVWVKP